MIQQPAPPIMKPLLIKARCKAPKDFAAPCKAPQIYTHAGPYKLCMGRLARCPKVSGAGFCPSTGRKGKETGDRDREYSFSRVLIQIAGYRKAAILR